MNGYNLMFQCMSCSSEAFVYESYDDIPKDKDGQWTCIVCNKAHALDVQIIYEDSTMLNYYQSSLQ